jgi:hypothetical protein
MNNRIKLITAFALVLLAALGLHAQRPTAKATLDSMAILIGDQVTLRIEVEHDKSISVKLPELPANLLEFVEVVDRKTEMIDPSGTLQKVSREFVITSFDTGFHAINPIWIHFQQNGVTDSVSTNELMLAVFTLPKLDSLMQAIKGPIDIKPTYEAPLTFKEVAPWIMGILLGAALLFLIFYAIKRQRSDKPLFYIPEKPKEPAHITALRELQRIRDEQLWAQGKTKLYYSELTDTVRRYIEDRFGIQAMEQTTEEILAAFKQKRNLLTISQFNELSNLLSQADLVKFAKYEPLTDENDAAIKKAIQMVEQTKFEEPILAEQAATGPTPETEV